MEESLEKLVSFLFDRKLLWLSAEGVVRLEYNYPSFYLIVFKLCGPSPKITIIV
jgi:hypothetical protein